MNGNDGQARFGPTGTLRGVSLQRDFANLSSYGEWLHKKLSMAGPYSNSNGNYNYGDRYGYNQSYRDYSYPDSSSNSLIDDFRAFLIRSYRWFWRFWRERGRRMVQAGMVALARRTRQNLAYNRLFSVPHLLVCVWIVVLLWGERWVFHSKVEDCHWDNWEKWVGHSHPPFSVARTKHGALGGALCTHGETVN